MRSVILQQQCLILNLNYFLGRRGQRGRGPPGGPGRSAGISFLQLGDGTFQLIYKANITGLLKATIYFSH